MTQEDLATATGLARSTIANLETRVKNPQFGTVARIARATGVSLDAIAAHEPSAVDLADVRALLEAVLEAELAIRDDVAALKAQSDEAGAAPQAD